jgi:hypothetical protein
LFSRDLDTFEVCLTHADEKGEFDTRKYQVLGCARSAESKRFCWELCRPCRYGPVFA